jgi:hypothetical protein
MPIQNITELEERLSRPQEADIEAMRVLDGDLLILGVGGKMGPSLARLARRATEMAGIRKRIIAVARFSNAELPPELASQAIETIACDLLEPGALNCLPEIPNVVFMAARKFGTGGEAHLTWAMNTFLPGSSPFRRATCIPCVPHRKAAQLRPQQSTQSVSTRSRRLAGSGCSNMGRPVGEPLR